MSIENPDEAYRWLLDRLREALPDVARQLEEEVARGRRVGASSLPEADRARVQERLKGAGSRMTKEDLASVDYSGQERLALLIEAVDRLGSSMVASRDALVRLLDRQEADQVRPAVIRLREAGEDDRASRSTHELSSRLRRRRWSRFRMIWPRR